MFYIKKKSSFAKKVSVDFIYTVSAVVVLNIVQQLLIQPYLNHTEGPEFLGDVLYYLGLTYVFSQTFGIVLGHQRVLNKHDEDLNDGDFQFILGIYAVIVFIIGAADAVIKTHNTGYALCIGAFMVICMVRYYAQVEFRVNLWFKGYLIYFLILSAGYLLGLLLYQFWHQWLVIFMTGEIAAIIFVIWKGKVLKPRKPGPALKKLWLPTTLLVFSYLLSSTSYLDRILIRPILGAAAVSEYYAVSLVSKVINLVVHPLATLMLSYLADRKTSGFTLKSFTKIALGGLGGCVLLIALCCIGTPIAVYILYPNLMGPVRSLNLPVNIGGVLGAAGSLLMTFLLAEAGVKYQVLMRSLCFAVYLVSTLWLTSSYGLAGYAGASIISNAFCCICAVLFGLVFYKRKADSAADKA